MFTVTEGAPRSEASVLDAHSVSASPPPNFTVQGFCRWLPMSKTKFYREVNAGKIRVRKSGKRTLITRDDAQAYIDSLPVFDPKAA